MGQMYLVLQHPFRANHLVKDVFSDVGVNGTERVIQQVDVTVLVDGTSQTDSLLLAAT